MTTADTQLFRILVVDDEPRVEDIVRENLGDYADEIRVDYASTAEAAGRLLYRDLYDLVLLDIYDKSDLNIGLEVYRRVDTAGLATRVILMTRFVLKEEDAPRLLQLTGSPSAWRLAGFIDKRGSLGAEVRGKVGREVERFRSRGATVTGIEPLANEIGRQRQRYKRKLPEGHQPLRKSHTELCTEIDRLIRCLYVDLPGTLRRGASRVQVDLTPMGRRGLSAAVVANATVNVTFTTMATGTTGHKTVLKIGPKSDIFEEAGRFFEYVRYGVELTGRVELLAVKGVDSLGGLVYSFAGGTYTNDLLSLDEVLVEALDGGNLQTSQAALQAFFTSKIWYAVECAPVDLGAYFADNYGTDLGRSCQDGERRLGDLTGRWTVWPRVERRHDRQQGVGVVLHTAGGDSLELPDASVLGWAQLAHNVETCLIHGDMHGGNVMIECSHPDGEAGRRFERTCLIDFRSSGPGPRCLDAVALESSIRLADAVLMGERVGDGPPSVAVQAEISDHLARCVQEEFALYRHVFDGIGEPPSSRWALLALALLGELKECFPDLSLREYLASSLRLAIRSLGFPLDEFARLRVSAWLAALYTLARELPS